MWEQRIEKEDRAIVEEHEGHIRRRPRHRKRQRPLDESGRTASTPQLGMPQHAAGTTGMPQCDKALSHWPVVDSCLMTLRHNEDFGDLVPMMRMRETRLQAHWVPRQVGAPVTDLIRYRPEFYFEQAKSSSDKKPWKRPAAGSLVQKDIDRYGSAPSKGESGADSVIERFADIATNAAASMASPSSERQHRIGEVSFNPVANVIPCSINASAQSFTQSRSGARQERLLVGPRQVRNAKVQAVNGYRGCPGPGPVLVAADKATAARNAKALRAAATRW